ncbi:MAG: hypothetical protein WC753_02825 [Candidatus Gracilibacteria bacterium]
MDTLQTLQNFLQQYDSLFPALQILLVGIVVSIGLYLLTEWVFHITGIEKMLLKIFGQKTHIGQDSLPRAIGKYIAIFVFLLFLRSSVKAAGYQEIEEFLGRVLDYLPHLLLALLVTFFGIQSSGTTYTIIYNALRFESKKTATLLGNIGRVVILFFTFSIALGQINYGVEIVPPYLIISILIGVVAAASLAFGLAFGLGGRAAAMKIINNFLMKKKTPIKTPEKSPEKNLKK